MENLVIENLCDDVKMKILGYLDPVNLVNFSLTCKANLKFVKVTLNLFNLYFEDSHIDNDGLKFFKGARTFTFVGCHKISGKGIKYLLKSKIVNIWNCENFEYHHIRYLADNEIMINYFNKPRSVKDFVNFMKIALPTRSSVKYNFDEIIKTLFGGMNKSPFIKYYEKESIGRSNLYEFIDLQSYNEIKNSNESDEDNKRTSSPIDELTRLFVDIVNQ